MNRKVTAFETATARASGVAARVLAKTTPITKTTAC